MKGKLGVGDVLGEVFTIYGARAAVLLPIAFWLFLVVAIVESLVGGSPIVAAAVAVAVGAIATTLYQGTVVELVSDIQDDRRDSSIGDLLRSASPFVLPLIGAGILVGIAVYLGLLLLVVPGLYLLTIWAVVAPVIVVEKSGVIDALGRSRELVRGNGWPVLGAVLAAVLIYFVALVILVLLGSAIADGVLVRIVFGAIASAIAAPIGGLAASVLYFRLRAIEGGPAAAASPTATPAPPGA